MRSILTHSMFLIVAGVVFVFAWTVPVFVYLRTASAVAYVQEVENQIGSQTLREAADRELKQLLLETKDARERLPQFAVPAGSVATLIDSIEERGRNARTTLTIGNVGVSPREGAYDVLTVSMQANGGFDALMRLLMLLETLPYASSVDSAVLDRSEKGAWDLTVTVSVLMHKDK